MGTEGKEMVADHREVAEAGHVGQRMLSMLRSLLKNGVQYLEAVFSGLESRATRRSASERCAGSSPPTS